MKNSNDTIGNRTRKPSGLWCSGSTNCAAACPIIFSIIHKTSKTTFYRTPDLDWAVNRFLMTTPDTNPADNKQETPWRSLLTTHSVLTDFHLFQETNKYL